MSNPVLESVMCEGNELRLINCPAVVPQDSCQTVGYAGVICQGLAEQRCACHYMLRLLQKYDGITAKV